ncbi:glycosyltransferase family 39 protein, partial [Candidatus Pacearchaeota archaeon]|nr:glycosyltransferase family 39 protein [Candidatus Pacearchaeota archaeon]
LVLGIPESGVHFLLVVVPSILLVYVIYLFGREAFNEKIGVYAAAASAFVWTYLFWTARFQPDFGSMVFQMLALFFFWKLFKQPGMKPAVLAGVCTALGFYFKISALIVPLSVLLYVCIKDGPAFLKNKYYWTAFLSFVMVLLPFLLWQMIAFDNAVAFAPSYIEGTDKAGREYGWQTLSYFQLFPKTLFFLLFLIGIAVCIFRMALSLDVLWKQKEKLLDAGLFSLIILMVTSLFYIFYIQGVIEDRWVFLLVPFVFYFSAAGIAFIEDRIKPYSRYLGILLVIVLFAFFIVAQVKDSSALIENKKASYLPVKEASLWIKEHSIPDETIFSISYTQTTAYAEREVHSYSGPTSEEGFIELLQEKKPDYLMISLFEPHPAWTLQQLRSPDGSSILVLPYFNSTVQISSQGQIIGINLKPVIERDGARFEYAYPLDTVNGVFVYKVNW